MFDKWKSSLNDARLRVVLIENLYGKMFLDRSKSILVCKGEDSELVAEITKMAASSNIDLEIYDCENYSRNERLHFK